MKRSELFNKYITNRSGERANYSENKIKLEYNTYERNYKEYLPKDKEAPILEIGSGTGHFLHYLNNNQYKNASGIELSKEEVEYVKSRGIKNIEYVEDTLQYLKEHKNKYSLIIMCQVIEHIPKNEVIEFLKHIQESLADDGTFLASTPNCANPLNVSTIGSDFTHEYIYTPESLTQICSMANFKKIKIIPFKEENLSYHSKITNITSPIIQIIIRYIIGFSRSYQTPSNIYTANIIALCKK